MKRTISVFLIFVIFLSMISCSSEKAVEIVYGTSELFTVSEMEPLVNQIVEGYKNNGAGIILYKVTYAGDEFCEKELERYCIRYEKEYEACMVFITSCIIPEGHATSAPGTHDDWWRYWFVKEPGGEWVLAGRGF